MIGISYSEVPIQGHALMGTGGEKDRHRFDKSMNRLRIFNLLQQLRKYQP